MPKLQFNNKYLKSTTTDTKKNNVIVSEWSSRVSIELAADTKDHKGDLITIPPQKPNKLKILLSIKNNDKILEQNLMGKILERFTENNKYWEENLLFHPEFSIIKDEKYLINLECLLWSPNKTNTLLQTPISKNEFNESFPKIAILDELSVVGDFYYPSNNKVNVEDIVLHFHEYFTSLLISQLEFRYPLVFSSITRKRLKYQENDFVSISCILLNSSFLTPKLIKLAESDKTSTTVYHLLNGDDNPVDFKIL